MKPLIIIHRRCSPGQASRWIADGYGVALAEGHRPRSRGNRYVGSRTRFVGPVDPARGNADPEPGGLVGDANRRGYASGRCRYSARHWKLTLRLLVPRYETFLRLPVARHETFLRLPVARYETFLRLPVTRHETRWFFGVVRFAHLRDNIMYTLSLLNNFNFFSCRSYYLSSNKCSTNSSIFKMV